MNAGVCRRRPPGVPRNHHHRLGRLRAAHGDSCGRAGPPARALAGVPGRPEGLHHRAAASWFPVSALECMYPTGLRGAPPPPTVLLYMCAVQHACPAACALPCHFDGLQRMQVKESWVLRRPVDSVRSPEDAQAALRQFYRRVAGGLRAEGVVATPAGARADKKDENDTLSHVAVERVRAGEYSLRGIPLFEANLTTETLLVPGPPFACAALWRPSCHLHCTPLSVVHRTYPAAPDASACCCSGSAHGLQARCLTEAQGGWVSQHRRPGRAELLGDLQVCRRGHPRLPPRWRRLHAWPGVAQITPPARTPGHTMRFVFERHLPLAHPCARAWLIAVRARRQTEPESH